MQKFDQIIFAWSEPIADDGSSRKLSPWTTPANVRSAANANTPPKAPPWPQPGTSSPPPARQWNSTLTAATGAMPGTSRKNRQKPVKIVDNRQLSLDCLWRATLGVLQGSKLTVAGCSSQMVATCAEPRLWSKSSKAIPETSTGKACGNSPPCWESSLNPCFASCD
jgi:hypothetical protein